MSAEQGDACVGVREVYETPRSNLVVAKGLFVSAQRTIIINARRQVAEVRRRQGCTRKRLEVPHVQDVASAMWRDRRASGRDFWDFFCT